MHDCEQFAARNNLQIVNSYIDRATTATTDKRPQFLKMIADSKQCVFDVVLVWKLDRFSRNRYDSAMYKKKLKDNGEYDQIYEKFFSGENDTTQVQIADNTGIIGTFKFIFLQDNRWKYYLNGLQVTLLVSIMSVLLGTVIGLMAAMIKLNADRKKKETVLSRIIHIYVDVIRGTPSVLQLMIVYFAVFHSRLGYVAAVVSFGINSGAYVSEVIRAGIMAVDKGQQEAGRSLGLGYKDTMRFIIIPQALKNILPAMGNEFIQLIKETSILGYVGIMDLTKASSYVSSRTYQMFIPLITAGIMYYLIVKILSIFLEKMERRMRQSD